MTLIQIVAYSENRAIGKNNQLLWHLADDMAFFKEMTTGETVLMGKNTYISLPRKFRPLPNRKNIVISSQAPIEHYENLQWFNSLDNALETLEKVESKVFIIGGARIYAQLIEQTDIIYATEVQTNLEGDCFFSEIHTNQWEREVLKSFQKNDRNEYDFEIVKYTRIKKL